MDKDTFVIEELQEASAGNAEAVRLLTKQIGQNFTELSDNDFADMIHSSCNHLFVVREKKSNQIIGMVTVLIYRIPYAKKAYIDDFVIDKDFRKHGFGTALFQKAIDFAKDQKVSYAQFTSKQTREAGNALYEKLGFQKYDTNVYRLNFSYEE
jgi:ribosomal protein S18 acetylase RimI-like enzyme